MRARAEAERWKAGFFGRHIANSLMQPGALRGGSPLQHDYEFEIGERASRE